MKSVEMNGCAERTANPRAGRGQTGTGAKAPKATGAGAGRGKQEDMR